MTCSMFLALCCFFLVAQSFNIQAVGFPLAGIRERCKSSMVGDSPNVSFRLCRAERKTLICIHLNVLNIYFGRVFV